MYRFQEIKKKDEEREKDNYVDATFANDDRIILNAVYGSLLDVKNKPTSIFLFYFYLNQKNILYKKIQ